MVIMEIMETMGTMVILMILPLFKLAVKIVQPEEKPDQVQPHL